MYLYITILYYLLGQNFGIFSDKKFFIRFFYFPIHFTRRIWFNMSFISNLTCFWFQLAKKYFRRTKFSASSQIFDNFVRPKFCPIRYTIIFSISVRDKMSVVKICIFIMNLIKKASRIYNFCKKLTKFFKSLVFHLILCLKFQPNEINVYKNLIFFRKVFWKQKLVEF